MHIPSKPDSNGFRLPFETEKLIDIIHYRHRKAQEVCHLRFFAARQIQCVYRGYKVRQYIKLLNKMAVIIQQSFRGYLGRIIYFNVLEETLQQKLVKFYNAQAIITQKLYRGYWLRLHTYDYYKMKNWIQIIKQKNGELGKQATEHNKNEQYKKLIQANEEAKKLCIFIGMKLHHLLRTERTPGIYSLTNTNSRSRIENFLSKLLFKETLQSAKTTQQEEKSAFIVELEKLYKGNNVLKHKFSKCIPHWRHRNVDLVEEEIRQENLFVDYHSNFKHGQIEYLYHANLFTLEKYDDNCNKLYKLSRKYDVLEKTENRKRFSLNAKIIEKPEKIDEFLVVLNNFCRIHNIVEK